MDREKLDNWCEKAILGLVLAILVIGPLAIGAVGDWQFLVLQGLTLVVILIWGVRLWASPRVKLLWPPICWAVLAFVAYAMVRYCQADIEYVARQELIKILVYAFLFFVILNNLHRQESTQIIALTLIFLALGISGYAIYQFLAKSDKVWNLTRVALYHGRASGTFYNPNNLAGFLEMILPLGLGYMMVGRLSHITKIFLGYASLMILVTIGFTVSRGGWIATGLVLLGLCGALLFHRNYRLQALVLLVVLMAIGGLLAPKLQLAQERFKVILSDGRHGDMRWSIWGPAVRMWEDHFWLGVGPSHFDYQYRLYRPAEVQLRPDRAHNDYLNTLADYGVVGTALVAAAWGLLLLGAFKTWKYVRTAEDDFARKKSNKFAFLLGASLGLMAILFHSLVDFNMHIPANAILGVTLMALLSSQLRFATERHWFTAGRWTKGAVTVIIMAGAVCFAYTGWRGGTECFRLRQAERQPVFSYARIDKLKQAWQVEPMNPATTFAIAECYWMKSRAGSNEYVALAKQAMEWYQRGMKTNSHDGYNWLGYGRCLDWINSPDDGKQEDSMPYYQRANELDPNGYFTTAYTGWHYVQTGDYAAARSWFERSHRLEWKDNEISDNYLPIVERRLQEATTGH